MKGALIPKDLTSRISNQSQLANGRRSSIADANLFSSLLRIYKYNSMLVQPLQVIRSCIEGIHMRKPAETSTFRKPLRETSLQKPLRD